MRGKFPTPFLITLTSYGRKTKQFVWETVGCIAYTAHFRPSATGGLISSDLEIMLAPQSHSAKVAGPLQ
jgi:hypothetical protein